MDEEYIRGTNIRINWEEDGFTHVRRIANTTPLEIAMIYRNHSDIILVGRNGY